MTEYIALVETKLKRFPVDSDTLEAADLHAVPKGAKLNPAPMPLKVAGHTLWSLGTHDLWWCFDSHWQPSSVEKPSADSSWIDERCIALVKKFEGFREEAYQDAVGVWTVGFGQTTILGRPVESTDVVTELDASVRLEKELAVYASQARSLIRVPVTRAMADAIVSFCWNLGVESFHQSTLLRKLNMGDYLGAAGEFQRWVHAGGEVLPGLVARRQTEAQLFMADGVPNKAAPVSEPFSHRDMNASLSKYFKWGEAWLWQKERITDDPVILKRIEALAVELDKLREKFGPIQVTSYYRPPAVNRACGGVENSRHLLGDAADVYPLQYDPQQFENWCDANWSGGVGLGISSGAGFVHLDLGDRRRWAYGV